MQRELLRKMRAQRGAKLLRLVGRQLEARAGDKQKPVSIGAQVDGIRPQPVRGARVLSESVRGKRSGRQRPLCNVEGIAEPILERAAFAVPAAAARQQQFLRGCGGVGLEEGGYDELYVH
jgi:hypothetical protein